MILSSSPTISWWVISRPNRVRSDDARAASRSGECASRSTKTSSVCWHDSPRTWKSLLPNRANWPISLRNSSAVRTKFTSAGSASTSRSAAGRLVRSEFIARTKFRYPGVMSKLSIARVGSSSKLLLR
ncbi:Uncharacterised protein [Mycobacteroides abscessus subsp. abscessus]|nr:Uncharacterised protein [Mycobacteroides abscessus subsp. abscessus]